MWYCNEEAITFDLAISREKKEKKETIAEKRRRQRSQRYYEVLCKNFFTQKIKKVERVQRIQRVKENYCLQSVELGVWSLCQGGWGTPLFVLYGYVPLDRVWFFGLAVLNRVYNLTSPVLKRFNTSPKQGMVCEQSLSFLRLRPGPCEKLHERVCDWADKRRVSFPDFHKLIFNLSECNYVKLIK